MKKNILITDKHKLEVNKRLNKSIEHLVSFEKGIVFKPALKKSLKPSSASYKFLAKSVLGFLEYSLNINNIDEEEISKVDKAFEKSIKLNQNDLLLFLKSRVSDEYEMFIRKNKIPVYDSDPFGKKDDLFDGLKLIDIFISFCNKFRYKKFCYFLDEHLNTNKRKEIYNKSFNIYTAFPDANPIFTEFIELRVTLFYINYLLDVSYESQLQDITKKEKEQSNKIEIDFSNLTYESDPVFELFFASKASFEIFKLTVLPLKGERLTNPELLQIFEFFRENKLKYQTLDNFTATPLGKTSDKSLFIKSINPFFTHKYIEKHRFDNASISSSKTYDVIERLKKNFKKIKTENKKPK